MALGDSQRREGTTLAGLKWQATEIRPRQPMIRWRRTGRSDSAMCASSCLGMICPQSSDRGGPGRKVRAWTPARESTAWQSLSPMPRSRVHRADPVSRQTDGRTTSTPISEMGEGRRQSGVGKGRRWFHGMYFKSGSWQRSQGPARISEREQAGSHDRGAHMWASR
jgi:hypothetical protein